MYRKLENENDNSLHLVVNLSIDINTKIIRKNRERIEKQPESESELNDKKFM